MLERFYDLMMACGIHDPIGREGWLRFYSENSELWPVIKQGEMVGGVLFKGHTVHIAIRPDWQKRWITKAMLRGYAHWKPTVDVVAPINKQRPDARRLADRLGLVLRSEDDHYWYYVKEKCDEHPV